MYMEQGKGHKLHGSYQLQTDLHVRLTDSRAVRAGWLECHPDNNKRGKADTRTTIPYPRHSMLTTAQSSACRAGSAGERVSARRMCVSARRLLSPSVRGVCVSARRMRVSSQRLSPSVRVSRAPWHTCECLLSWTCLEPLGTHANVSSQRACVSRFLLSPSVRGVRVAARRLLSPSVRGVRVAARRMRVSSQRVSLLGACVSFLSVCAPWTCPEPLGFSACVRRGRVSARRMRVSSQHVILHRFAHSGSTVMTNPRAVRDYCLIDINNPKHQ